MKAKQLAASVLTAALLLGGCSGRIYTDNQQPSAPESEVSQVPEGPQLPENGGFGTVSYSFSEDKYRTFYEIFPYSFYDSNGDGIGDLNGITEKLDYLNDGDTATTDDLGIEGIWLMPVMQSPSYHKYNVTDYMTIDKAYGTNDDMKKLLDEAHKRHIRVIIDLVVNHSSRTNEWFVKALEELKEGKTDGYADYYHFKQNNKERGWHEAGVGDWYYEGQFDVDMPDLNLENESLREELQEIMKYWLDMGVDGFRLDAVWWFESGNTFNDDEGSIEELKWMYDYAKTVNPDVYMVGECWKDTSTIKKFYQSGIDSFFNFDMQGTTGRANSAVNTSNAQVFVEYLEKWQKSLREENENAIDAVFISNHDTARSASFISSNTGRRLAAALYLLSPGNSFVYYGEEIGMTGSQNDPEKRTGMYWSATDTKGYVETIPEARADGKPDTAVDEQIKDDSSLQSFYRRAIALKNQNPEIARGTLTAVDLGDKATAGYITEYNGSKVMVIFNLADKQAEVNVPESTLKISEVRGYLDANAEENTQQTNVDDLFAVGTPAVSEDAPADKGEFSISGQTLTMPANSVIVLK